MRRWLMTLIKPDCNGRPDLPDCKTCARKGQGDRYPLVKVQWEKGRIAKRECLSYRKRLP